MTRLWVSGKLVRVEVDGEGLPTAFVLNERVHPVQQIADHWRVDMEWWRWHIWRDYFKLTTRTRLLVLLYHDLLYDQWYLQRIYD